MQCKLKITRKTGENAVLLLGVGNDHTWSMEAPVEWVPATDGKWLIWTGAVTKGSKTMYLSLRDAAGNEVFGMKLPPYKVAEKLTATLHKDKPSRFWIFYIADAGETVDVEVLSAPNPAKTYRIREKWDATVSVGVATGEHASLEVLDPDKNLIATYHYTAAGLGFGLPIKKLPNVIPGLSTPGPWNDFTAPEYMTVDDFGGDAWMSTLYSLGMGSEYSVVDFKFAGHQEGRVGYLVHMPQFSTGRTWALPSTGDTSGSMELFEKGKAYTP